MITLPTHRGEVTNLTPTTAYYDSVLQPDITEATAHFRDIHNSDRASLAYVLTTAAYGFVGDMLGHEKFTRWAQMRMLANTDPSQASPNIDIKLFDSTDPSPRSLRHRKITTEQELVIAFDACRYVLNTSSQLAWCTAVSRYVQSFHRSKNFPNIKGELVTREWDSYYARLNTLGLLAIAATQSEPRKHAVVTRIHPRRTRGRPSTTN